MYKGFRVCYLNGDAETVLYDRCYSYDEIIERVNNYHNVRAVALIKW